MKRILLRTTVAASALCAALAAVAPAFAEDGGGGTVENLTRHDVEPVVLWSLGSIAAGALVMGMLYLLKRRVGGFPKNPAWVAPITIMPSKDFPGDSDPHGAAAPGHDSHAAPAHH